MKRILALPLVSAALLLFSASTYAADARKAPDDRPKLTIVVVENVRRSGRTNDDFARLDLAFRYVAEQRKWPVAIETERFATNLPAIETELRVVLQPVREETSGDLTFRGWMTLTIQGVKHDFGIVSFRYYMRPGEDMDDVMEKIFRGAANAAADKIEPLLFPKPADTAKP